MKNGIRKLISAVLCLTLLFTLSSAAFAKAKAPAPKNFKDVKPGHWAYEAIMWRLDRNIIDGVGGNRFDPNGTVTRAQFAKMMVNTLDLKEYAPQTPSFLDVKKNSWEYPCVESAKPYLTGFRTSPEIIKAVTAGSEGGMAVALVNAMGYQNEKVDESILVSLKTASIPRISKLAYHCITDIEDYGKQTVVRSQGNLTAQACAAQSL